ncbi:inositol-3-phosphate synthase [Nonomuraea sp. NPDC004580]|uniref:inositol-3-phosphate synthase n=1 Tax=Nonomuraea sp. NPDC004580 TaxID=3154552 RepID=UPI00339EBEF8
MRTGIWLIGARGSVGTTATLGAAAMRAGLVAPTGCVTARPDFASVPLTEFGDLVFGGHELVDTPLLKRAEQLVDARVVPAGLPALVERDLRAAEEEIRPSPLATAPDQRAGLYGPLAELAFFFKDPLGTREHGLERQYDTLVTWAHSVSSAAS